MNKIKLISIALSFVITICYSYDQNFDHKFCDRNLSQNKLAQFQKCDQYVPKVILDASNQCLKDLKIGTTYNDFRNTICDKNLRKSYINCHTNKMNALTTAGSAAEITEDKVEMFRKHETCMRAAIG